MDRNMVQIPNLSALPLTLCPAVEVRDGVVGPAYGPDAGDEVLVENGVK